MKKNGIEVFSGMQRFKKMRFIFKRSLLLLFMSLFFLQVGAKSQVVRLTMNLEDVTIDQAITNVSQKTGYRFLYQMEEVIKYGKRNLSVKDATLEEVLNELLKDTPLSYVIQNDVVIITPAKDEKAQEKPRQIKGKVVDEKSVPLPGVTILIEGTKLGVVTDADGKFKIEIPKMDSTILVFSFIGMETIHYRLSDERKNDEKELVITMKEEVNEMDEVVVTGYANIRKESFTGNTVSVKKEELLKASKTNVIKALQAFDPSFRIKENNQWGSDPNALPEMHIRGESGIGIKQLDPNYTTKGNLQNNPNLPTFIMDGFEISVQKLYDFDINRIESITILKDAAATALYGSRAANGVVVITTVAPKPGKLNVSYSFTGSVVAPDLSDYDLLNAREKLEVEKLAGCYVDEDFQIARDQEYNKKLANIEKGIDTYWLAKPLETVFNHKHSLFIEGGSENVRFGLDLSYNTNKGVMIGSYRDNIGVALYVDYRIGKLQVKNQVSYNLTKSAESPYGDFSKYAYAQPYDTYKDENGKYLERLQDYDKTSTDTDYRENPLYESTLMNYDKSKIEEFINNLSANWYITQHLLLKGTFSITRTVEHGDRFLDPLSKQNAEPLSMTHLYSGELRKSNGESFNWDMNLLLAYNRTFDKHNVNFTVGINTKEDYSESGSAFYKGFPSGSLNSPNYAKEIYEKPTQSEGKSRLFGAIATVNYSFRDIYLFDFSGRIDGSSKFGSDRKYAPFWSTGFGINIHNYAFMDNYKYIDELKIRGSYGQTGNVNFSDYEAKTIYSINDEQWYQTGAGATLTALGNKDLTWETTNTLDVGIELSILNRLFYIKASYYNKKTTDCINSVTVPSSTGFNTYKDNIGEVRNRGYEIDLRMNIIRKQDLYLALFGNLSHNQNRLMKIAQSLRDYNTQVDEYFKTNSRFDGSTSKPFNKYVEGISMNTIWGVRSMGIDPSNGNEVFIRPEGTLTDVWNTSDQVAIGCTDPDAQGSFGFNLTYKNFSLFTNFMYEFGGQRYNQTLVDRVENADIYNENVDKRVLTDRWQKAGDKAKFKKLESGRTGGIETTNPTSRFVQDYNMVSLSSISLGYDFTQPWVKKARLSMLRFEIGAEDLVRWSSVKEERGLSYPFARTINFSLKASF